jgi:hypothetical protein
MAQVEDGVHGDAADAQVARGVLGKNCFHTMMRAMIHASAQDFNLENMETGRMPVLRFAV